MSDSLFVLSNTKFEGENATQLQLVLTNLIQQLNAAKIPISIGPTEVLPESIQIGQPVIDWTSGSSVYKVWNGENLI